MKQMGIEKFRRTALRMRSGKGRSARYPAEVRAWAVQYAEAELAEKRTVTSVAGQLGISDMTLRAWLYAASRKPVGRLCEVVVAEPEPEATAPARALTLTTAGGHVVTGLDLEGAATLLKALG
jgi:transposase-like protein